MDNLRSVMDLTTLRTNCRYHSIGQTAFREAVPLERCIHYTKFEGGCDADLKRCPDIQGSVNASEAGAVTGIFMRITREHA
jgi:hypothetical protein